MNLVINGCEAISAESGTLKISTGRVVLEEDEATIGGTYIYMEVQDSGCGMDELTKGKSTILFSRPRSRVEV